MSSNRPLQNALDMSTLFLRAPATDAGMVAMATLYDRGAERGDEVITPALAFVATVNVILAAGLMPKFVDVELETLNIDPAQIEAAISPRTRAIQVVHTMGKALRYGGDYEDRETPQPSRNRRLL